ncbi:hypothetical protein SDC9_139707 [bioreactor metagenome]|uniref:Uncharacterized protein n=1 Tax=bioreactor metagenome TaxID=1076179 RepID=A0A645DW53_9ZZZZ
MGQACVGELGKDYKGEDALGVEYLCFAASLVDVDQVSPIPVIVRDISDSE